MKTVIVNGATGGMVLETLRLLAQREVNVVCVDIDESRMSEAISALGKARGEVLTQVADVSDEAAVAGYVARTGEVFGSLHGIFNIAGIEGEFLTVQDATVENFDRVMGVNTRSVFLNMKHGAPHLIAAGGGAIVSTGSYVDTRGVPLCASYGASKHAVVGLTKSFALEMAEHGVSANVVAPGAMDTRMIRALFSAMSDDAGEAESKIVQDIPQRRLPDPCEVAAAGIWLLLDAPSHITGQVLRVDGGRSAG